jgi:hypothetical protein
MRFKLEDNTQEAFQFILLGAAIVLVLRLAIHGAGLLVSAGDPDMLNELSAHYRNDYVITDPTVLVSGGMDITGRLSFAALLAMGAAILGGAIGWFAARSTGGDTVKVAVRAARLGLLTVLVPLLYSALLLPPGSVELTPEEAIVRRRASVGGLGMPWPAREERIPWSSVSSVQQRRIANTGACGVMVETVLHTPDAIIPMTRTAPGGRDCDAAIAGAGQMSTRLAQLVRERYLRP